MLGREKVFFTIGRSIDGWLEMITPDDPNGDSLSVPLNDEFVDALIKLLEKADEYGERVFDVTIKEIKEAVEFGKHVLKEEEEKKK